VWLRGGPQGGRREEVTVRPSCLVPFEVGLRQNTVGAGAVVAFQDPKHLQR